jgi:hypothetical protein
VAAEKKAKDALGRSGTSSRTILSTLFSHSALGDSFLKVVEHVETRFQVLHEIFDTDVLLPEKGDIARNSKSRTPHIFNKMLSHLN